MTVICALRDPKAKCVWIGSDLQTTFYDLRCPTQPKWVVADNWAIGVSGDVRARNVLDRHWPEIVKDHSHIVDITSAVRDLIKQDGYLPKEGEDRFPGYGQFLIVTDGERIWDVSSNFSCRQIPDGELCANGSGFRLSYGAFFILKDLDLPARDIVRQSIEAANQYDTYCGNGTWVHAINEPAAHGAMRSKRKA